MIIEDEIPQRKDAIVKSTKPVIKISRYRPVLSASFPNTRSIEARAKRYPVITHAETALPTPKSAVIDGRAIDTILVSR